MGVGKGEVPNSWASLLTPSLTPLTLLLPVAVSFWQLGGSVPAQVLHLDGDLSGRRAEGDGRHQSLRRRRRLLRHVRRDQGQSL